MCVRFGVQWYDHFNYYIVKMLIYLTMIVLLKLIFFSRDKMLQNRLMWSVNKMKTNSPISVLTYKCHRERILLKYVPYYYHYYYYYMTNITPSIHTVEWDCTQKSIIILPIFPCVIVIILGLLYSLLTPRLE